MSNTTFSKVGRGLYSLLICAGLLFTSCSEENKLPNPTPNKPIDIEQVNNLKDFQNDNIATLKKIVDAAEQNDGVTAVTPTKEGETIVGYTIAFKQSGEIAITTIKENITVLDAPLISAKKSEDKKFYWTIDGEWLLNKGQKVAVSGEDSSVPMLKAEEGLWYVSFDNGKNWSDKALGSVTIPVGDDQNLLFNKVEEDKSFVYIYLNGDGTILILKKYVEQAPDPKPEPEPEPEPNPDPNPNPNPGTGDDQLFAGQTVWMYGLNNIPNPSDWKVIEPMGEKKYGLAWDASYGWFDCNKVDPTGNIDNKQCWAASASNLIHWWLKVHEEKINKYGNYKGPHGYKSSTDEGVFTYFKSKFINDGNVVHHGLNWFFTGLNQFQPGKGPQEGDPAGYLKEVLGEGTNMCEYREYPSAKLLTEMVKDALKNNKGISLVQEYGGIPHAINMWGATFDESGKMIAVYITDNNDIQYENNKAPLTPGGMIKCPVQEGAGGYMYMANWAGKFTMQIMAITRLSLMTEKWDNWFATHK